MTSDLARYHRQMLLPGIGEEGQRRLQASTALLLGCGALGSIAADMLARAGVGRLVIVDRDIVELTNLQRQVLFNEHHAAAAMPKAEAAKRTLADINSQVQVTAIVDDINHTNIERFADGADVLIDGLDNMETRYLANDVAVKSATPYVYGAAVGTTGMTFTVLPHGSGEAPWEADPERNYATPCFRCLFEEAPPPGSSATCDTVGVIGSVVGVVANLQVIEALKLLTGNYQHLNRTLQNLDLWANELHQLNVGKAYANGDCLCCKQRQFEYLEGRAGSSAVALCGRDAVQLNHRQSSTSLDLESLAARLRELGDVTVNEFMLQMHIREHAQDFDITLFPNGRAIIKGTDKADVARRIYAKFVGN